MISSNKRWSLTHGNCASSWRQCLVAYGPSLVVWKVFVLRRVSVELMDIMVELSSVFSVLFITLERYYQHLKAIISAFGNVQYHGEISSPLGGTLSVLQKVLITLEGKMDDKPPNGIVRGFSVTLIFLCGTDDVPFAVFVYYKEFPRRHSSTLMTECPMAIWVRHWQNATYRISINSI